MTVKGSLSKVEHRTDIAEVMGLNLVEASDSFSELPLEFARTMTV